MPAGANDFPQTLKEWLTVTMAQDGHTDEEIKAIVARVVTAQPTAIIPLSPELRLTLELAADGHTDEQIAALMHVDTTTVVQQLRSARGKLGARNVKHAIAIALRHGYIL